MTGRGSPPLLGNGFRLERFREEFIGKAYLSWMRDPEIQKTILAARPSITLEDIRAYCHGLMANDNEFFFAIVAADGRHIGNLRLGPVDFTDRKAEFGMMIGDKSYHGKGVGSGAVCSALDFAFGELKLSRVSLYVLDHNAAAIRVYEKNGFKTEAVVKRHVVKEGVAYDARRMTAVNPRGTGIVA